VLFMASKGELLCLTALSRAFAGSPRTTDSMPGLQTVGRDFSWDFHKTSSILLSLGLPVAFLPFASPRGPPSPAHRKALAFSGTHLQPAFT